MSGVLVVSSTPTSGHSDGQSMLIPSQTRSQRAPGARQVVFGGCLPSGGQLGPLPGHFSATSQTPFCERQTVVEGSKPSGGQFGPVPVQTSATSQTPFFDRQTVPEVTKPSAGQLGPLPGQFSATSQSP